MSRTVAKRQWDDHSVHVRYDNVQQPSSAVRDLDTYLDADVIMKQHTIKTTAACFHHIRRLCQVCSPVGQQVTK